MSNTEFVHSNPKDLGYRMPAEWEAHAACWMAWPTDHEQWEDLAAVEQSYADVANAIARFEPLKMVAHPFQIGRAQQLCGPGVEVVGIPIDDSWMRDAGPSFLKHESGEVAGTAWRFNCWGGYTPYYAEDAQLAGRILGQLSMGCYRSSLTIEGGAIHVDGAGTLVTTESVALNANRNFGMNHAEAEAELCRGTGASKVIWLPGDPDGITGDMTDGHVDGIMCFVKPGVALVESDPSLGDDIARLDAENRRALELATDAAGNKLDVIALNSNSEGVGDEYELFCSSYINFYLPNGGVIMPAYGVAADQQVADQLGTLFPDREVVMVDINAIAPGGGGIHCITQQQPA